MGLLGFVLGTIAAQFAGGWAYRRATLRAWHKTGAAIASGLLTGSVAALTYIPFRVHDWVAGEGSSVGVSIFLGLCIGIVQGALWPRGPLAPRA